MKRRTFASAACAVVVTGILAITGCGGGDGPVSTNSPPPPPPVPPGTGGLAVSAFLGGSDEDQLRDVAVDVQGNIFVAGGAASTDYPTTSGVVQPAHDPGPAASSRILADYDVVVTKLDSEGRIVWSTYLGGPGYDRAYAVEVDSQGFVYVAGRAGEGFPITSGAVQTFAGGPDAQPYGPQDGFVCKLNPSGTQVVFCTYIGASDRLILRDLAVDAAGDIYVVGGHESGSFPSSVANSFTNGRFGGDDVFIAKLSGDGSEVLWATYLGGSGTDRAQASVRVDGSGTPYVLLTTNSTNAFTSAGAYQTTMRGDEDLYVARLNPASGSVVAATYLGGSRNESTETHEFAVGVSGDVYVAAATKSTDFPVTQGAVQPSYGGGGNDSFISHLSPDLTTLVASTYFGGSENDRPEGVAVGPDGTLAYTGVTSSNDFPVSDDAFQASRGGPNDAIVVMLSADLTTVVYATLIGGSAMDFGRGAAMNASGDLYMVGLTTSGDWPTTGGGAGRGYGGGVSDGVLAVVRDR